MPCCKDPGNADAPCVISVVGQLTVGVSGDKLVIFGCNCRYDNTPSSSSSSSKASQKPSSNGSRLQPQPPQQQPPQSEEQVDSLLLKALVSESDAEADANDENSNQATGAAGWAATIGVVAGISILLGGGYVCRGQIKHFLDFFIQAVDDWGIWGYLAYAAVYAGLEVLAVPAIPLTMTAGAIFGPIPGTIVVSISATFAATIAFLIARYAARDKVCGLYNDFWLVYCGATVSACSDITTCMQHTM